MTEQELAHFKDCEAREWLRRYQSKKQELGKTKAFAWWQKTLSDLERIRGEKTTNELRERMNARNQS